MATPAPKHWLLTYTYVDGILEKRGPYRTAHLANAKIYLDAGKIVIGGAVGDPPNSAMLLWGPAASEEDIHRFMQADPYVKAGLVIAWTISPFTVAVKAA
ncbi:hypothetical protein V8C86DRAFT_2789396 [Haematococcus lacustris]